MLKKKKKGMNRKRIMKKLLECHIDKKISVNSRSSSSRWGKVKDITKKDVEIIYFYFSSSFVHRMEF